MRSIGHWPLRKKLDDIFPIGCPVWVLRNRIKWRQGVVVGYTGRLIRVKTSDLVTRECRRAALLPIV